MQGFFVPFPSLIWLHVPHNWASAEQTMTSVLVQPELSHLTGRRCTQSCSDYGSNSFPLLYPFVFLFYVRGGVESVLSLSISTLSLSSSHSPANFIPPVFGCKPQLTHRIWSKPFLFLLVDSESSESVSYNHKDVKDFRTRGTVGLFCGLLFIPPTARVYPSEPSLKQFSSMSFCRCMC